MSLPFSSMLRWELLDALKSTKARIQEICKISGVAGLSMVVIDRGETILQDNLGYRDTAKKEPVTSDTVFPIASLTKSFTGACINRLRAQGRLILDDLIKQHLPEAESRDPVLSATLTIADLLGHRTGLQKADNIWLGAEGELMFDRNQTATVFSHLRPQTSLRSQFRYNNICYALLGEIVAKVSGQPYHTYLKENILDPLDMLRTLVTRDVGLPDNSSQAYSTLDNGEPCNVPLPGLTASGSMGAAGGLLSTASDLATYYKALMKSWPVQEELKRNDRGTEGSQTLFNDILWLLAPLQIMEIPSLFEKSYATGWARSLLPTTVGDLGVNSGLVDRMPLLADGINPRLALWHQGSLVGATSFVMLLPETESAVLVLTNTMALNDAPDWIGQLLVETLLDSPVRHDYANLTSLSAGRALQKYTELARKVEEGRESSGPDRALRDYIGSYVGFGGIFRILVVETEQGLEVLFQGRQSQRYHLEHHHRDSFTWFMSWNEQVRRARFIVFQPAFYSIWFANEEGKGVVSLNWVHDSTMPEGEDFIKE